MTDRVEAQTIAGPRGSFQIPLKPEYVRKTCELLTHRVWAGEYEHPSLPKEGIEYVLDIGCCLGAFAVWALSKWPRLIHIQGYDPHEEALAFFKQNVCFSDAHCLAVTTAPGPVEFHMYSDWGMCSTHYGSNNHGAGYERLVDTIHPKDLPCADLLKIDAEGVEGEICDNYPYLDKVKVLLVEYHDLTQKEQVRAAAAGAGLSLLEDHVEAGSCQGIYIWNRK